MAQELRLTKGSVQPDELSRIGSAGSHALLDVSDSFSVSTLSKVHGSDSVAAAAAHCVRMSLAVGYPESIVI